MPQADNSWTHSLDSDRKREHDFSNCLQELVYAAERADVLLVSFYADLARLMYRQANRDLPGITLSARVSRAADPGGSTPVPG